MYKNNFYSRFNPPGPSVYGKKLSSDSKTVQSFAFESDINNLLKTTIDKEGRAIATYTGVSSSLPPNDAQPKYGDFTMYNREDLISAMNLTAQAKQMFAELPSDIRDRFANDPTKLVAFVSDSSNYEEAVKLGICKKRIESPVNLNPPVDTQPVVTPTLSE